MNRLTLTPLALTGLTRVERERLSDERGFLSRLFCAKELGAAGWSQPIAQINHTQTAQRGTVRGLHYQRAPQREAKLVTCLRGEVWDVVVDLRSGSPTFLQWHAEHLSADNGRALLIPAGFAHGFQTLKNDTELLYCHSAAYAPSQEAAINVHDPRLAIPWPLPVMYLSARDAAHAMLPPAFEGVPL